VTRGFLRFFIAAVLLATAAGKLLDVRGFAAVLESYDAIAERALLPFAVAIPLLELAVGLWLVSGRRLAAASLAAAAMHLLYAGWSAASVLRGLKLANCGCFGVFLARPLGWSTVVEDSLMVALSLALYALARRPA
jgi:uncharacterized membrane protein YphA (DoxX/SURF4 family)